MSDTLSARRMLEEPDFLKALDEAAAGSGKNRQQALQYARKCLREIEATPRTSWLRPAAKLARFIYTRSYEARLDINLEQIERLRTLSQEHLIVFLWSHKSHMDSFVFLLSLYENRFKPLPLIFAGVNMNFLGFGALARRVGAIFLRRSFADDAIYKLVFKRYIDFLIQHKRPLSWSIEGTRSRTGKLSPPKLGVLNWVYEACEREQMKDVLFVPVSIAFDRIAEIDDYVAMQKGLPKRKESLKWFIDYIFGQRSPYGKVYVRYGEPLPLKDVSLSNDTSREHVGITDGPTPEATQRIEVTRLAFEVCRRIEQITPIKSTDVLTMVLLGTNGRALTGQEVAEQAKAIADLLEQRNLPRATGFALNNQAEVDAALLALLTSGLIESYSETPIPVYYIPDDQLLAAAYYRNTVNHYFMRAALGEMGLAMCTQDIEQPSEASLRRHVKALRNLYKFEFFYKPSSEFWQDILDETNARYPGWQDGESSIEKHLQTHPPRFAHAILRSFTEAYLILAVALLELGDEPMNNEKQFLQHLLQRGEQMRLRQSISCESSISQDLFTNGLRMAAHRGILQGDAALPDARREFYAQVWAALEAINRLQTCYDQAWFSPAPESLPLA